MELQRLTKRQRLIFNVLVQIKNRQGKIASLQDIANVYGCSRQAVKDHLTLLEKKNYVFHIDGKYIPTSEGIEQFMLDTNKPERIKITKRYEQ